jgi:hypothetical protein
MYTAPLTEAQAVRLGRDVGRISALVARALNEEYPHLDVLRLVESFTRPKVLEGTAVLYLAALEKGATPGEAAGEAGVALVRVWAEARLKAREDLAGRDAEG